MTTADINIHNVKSITVGDRKLHDANGTNPFYTREIVIVNDQGSIAISLFCHSDDEDTALKVQS